MAEFWSGYTGELDGGQERMLSTARVLPFTYSDLKDIPEIIDPWILDKNLSPTEDQANQGSCFPRGVSVRLTDGEHCLIESMAIGMMVEDIDGKPRRVTDVMCRSFTGKMYELHVRNWGKLHLTEDHVVFVMRGTKRMEVRADQILESDLFLCRKGVSADWRPLLAIDYEEVEDVDVYDITVDESHSFFADGIGVHNCQGQALSECVEYCYFVATGKIVQISRQFCYLGSQKHDGIDGDNGSTLEGGTKLVEGDGACLEEFFEYLKAYPRGGHRAIPKIAWEKAEDIRLAHHVDIDSWDTGITFLAGGQGIIQIGIPWGDFMEPDDDGCIEDVRIGRDIGGHSVVFNGYAPDRVVGRKSKEDRWMILKNSWSQRWGKNGRAYVSRRAFEKLRAHEFTSMYGRTDVVGLDPRPVPFDFQNFNTPGKGRY